MVRNATPDFMTPANAFETNVGHFWGIVSTRDYMRARFALADACRRIGTLDSIKEGLEHLQDMLRLCRGDNMGVRDIIPTLMLQLDRDQECYDFVKWWETKADEGYDWGNTDLPYLDVKDADVFESVDFLDRRWLNLNQVVAVLLLKLKLLVDIENIGLVRKAVATKVPGEIQSKVEIHTVRSPLSLPLLKREDEEIFAIELRLCDQIQQLGYAVHEANSYFWVAMLNPADDLTAHPEAYSQGSAEQMQFALQNAYTAWWQTEPVIEILQKAVEMAAPDEAAMQSHHKLHATRSVGDEQVSDEEFRRAFGVQGMWSYIENAVETLRS